MLAEELKRINESEAEADELQQRAKAESKDIIDEARIKAEKTLRDAENHAKDIYDRLIGEGAAEASAGYDSYMESIRHDCRVLADRAKEREEDTIAMIAERIVRRSVDC